jgi:hypothetical protein
MEHEGVLTQAEQMADVTLASIVEKVGEVAASVQMLIS